MQETIKAKDLTPLEGQQLIQDAKQAAITKANEHQIPTAVGTMLEKLYEGVLGYPLKMFSSVNGWPAVNETTWQSIALEITELVQIDNEIAAQGGISENDAYTKSLLFWMNYGFTCTAHDPEAPTLPDYAIHGGNISVTWER